MARRTAVLCIVLAVAAAPHARAQNTGKLALIFRNIYGPNGLVVDSQASLPDGSTHSAHFNSGFQSEFTQFNIAMASQLTVLPVPSPASGFTYTFDTSTGTFKRSTQSFGPILAERAETIGKGRFAVGMNYQQFNFNTIEGIDLSRVPAVFKHDDYQLGGGRADVVTTNNSIEAAVGQITPFLTYGVTNQIDISLAVPIVHTRLRVTSDATIRRIGTESNPLVHYFSDPSAPNGIGSQREFAASGTATGLGDLIVRVKGTVVKKGFFGLALGTDVRVPSGDEKNLLGSGAPGVKPFAALSFVIGNVSPHLNAAYQWNGKSELAGDIKTGAKADLPNQVMYVAGADFGVNKKMTLAVDFFGQTVENSPRLFATSFTAVGPTKSETFPDIGFRTSTFTQVYGSAGIKSNVGGNILVNFNLRFGLNHTGLRDKVTPLIGIEYGF
jgi:hypothetical protein